jgi:taurine---2-oxoglutarate transaminase
VPGKKAKELSDEVSNSNYAGFNVGGSWHPPAITRGEGVHFYDADGNEYLDFSSQPACVNLGHNNRAVIKAIQGQAEKLDYIGASFATDARATYSEKLRTVLPSNLEKYYFGTSGTEANEAAFRMVRSYFAKEGKTKVMSRYNSYHGWAGATGTLTGNARRFALETGGGMPGVVHVPDPYCYRCPLGLKYPECGVACADYVDYAIKSEGGVGGLILEPVTGASGVVVPPKEYLPKIRKITQENDVFLIVDEVMCGWGRTGEWFATQHWDVEPDILTTAKAMTGGHFPLSLTATNKRLAEYYDKNWLPVAGTFSAHPLGMAAGAAAIDEYKRLGLIKKSALMGKHVGKRLAEMKEHHRSIGDVRGLGLFWALELVKNRATKKPFDTPDDYLTGANTMVHKVAQKMMADGIFIYTGVVSHLIISPPLIITKEQLDTGLDALDEALNVADAETERAQP